MVAINRSQIVTGSQKHCDHVIRQRATEYICFTKIVVSFQSFRYSFCYERQDRHTYRANCRLDLPDSR